MATLPTSLRALLALLALSWACAERIEVPRRPNIVLLLADDLGYGDLRANNPSAKIEMPNLERLAREGLRFTDAHSASAVCAPSRYSLVTGNYAWRGRNVRGVWRAWAEPMIPAEQTTLAELLRSAGYRSAKVGKDHQGGRFRRRGGSGTARRPEQIDYAARFRGGPTDRGFDTSFILPGGIQDPPFAFFRDGRLVGDAGALRHWEVGTYGESQILRPGRGVPDWDSSRAGPRILEEALAFLRAHQARNEAEGTEAPFFLFYSAVEVHWPWTPAGSIAGRPVRGVTGLGPRADLVVQFDIVLGELLAELERQGSARNTLVIVTSDNGGDVFRHELRRGHSSVGILAGAKGKLAEGGHRVPLVVRWGDGTPAGSTVAPGGVVAETVGLQDLYATLAEVADVHLGPEQGRDSYSLLPLLLGVGGSRPIRDHLIVQDNEGPDFGFREGEWKLVVDREGRTGDLFRVAPDGTERDAGEILPQTEYEERRAAMRERFSQLRAATRTAPWSGVPEEAGRMPGVDQESAGVAAPAARLRP